MKRMFQRRFLACRTSRSPRDASTATLERFTVLPRRELAPDLCAVALCGRSIDPECLAPGFALAKSGVAPLADLRGEGYI